MAEEHQEAEAAERRAEEHQQVEVRELEESLENLASSQGEHLGQATPPGRVGTASAVVPLTAAIFHWRCPSGL